MADSLDWLDDALTDLDRRGLRRMLAERQSPQRGDRIVIDGRSLVNFGSNDYLGLAADPRIAAAVKTAIEEEGWGAGASPLVTGRSGLHARLERELADFQGTEAALLFPSGYDANVGAITSLVGKGDAVYSDELNHASIIDGCRLSGAAIHVYPNTDKDNLHRLESLLRDAEGTRRRLIVSDSLFSMHGTTADVVRLADLAKQYDATLLVDEAHAVGVIGERARGLCDGLDGFVHVKIGTLSKALGGHGGFVVGSQKLIDWLVNRARPYMFSTAAPAALAAAGIEALHIIQREPDRRQKVHDLTFQLRGRLLSHPRLIQPLSLSHIVPVILGDPARTLATSTELRRRGFFVPAIRPPSVPEGQSLLRISVTCLHTEQQIDDLVAALCEVVENGS
jgi:8-amino-7-oxononanoate synthase